MSAVLSPVPAVKRLMSFVSCPLRQVGASDEWQSRPPLFTACIVLDVLGTHKLMRYAATESVTCASRRVCSPAVCLSSARPCACVYSIL
ncbi:hypothetical protein BD311DRAFT_754481, partial [Dichomitus squalens]